MYPNTIILTCTQYKNYYNEIFLYSFAGIKALESRKVITPYSTSKFGYISYVAWWLHMAC